MPLSEREQQILDELERELRPGRPAREASDERFRGLKLGIVVFVAGILLLVWFFVSGLLIAGVASFGAMVAGIVLGASSVASELGRSGNAGERIARNMATWDDALRRRFRDR